MFIQIHTTSGVNANGNKIEFNRSFTLPDGFTIEEQIELMKDEIIRLLIDAKKQSLSPGTTIFMS